MPIRQPELTAEQAEYRRINASKGYKYQAFPAARYHWDGRCVVVASEEDSVALCPEEDGWQDAPYPPKAYVKPVPEPTVAELKLELAAANAVCAEQIAEILELRSKLETLAQAPAVITPEFTAEAAPVEALPHAPVEKKKAAKA